MKRLKENTAFRLSTTIAIVMLICLVGVHFLGEPLAKIQLLKEERTLVQFKLDQYISCFERSGHQGLLQQLRADKEELKVFGMVVRLADENNTTLWEIYPTKEIASVLAGDTTLWSRTTENWTTVFQPAPFTYRLRRSIMMLPDEDIVVMYKTMKLDSRLNIQVGRGFKAFNVKDEMVATFFKYANLIFTAVIFISSVILIHLALRPLKNMLMTIHRISAGDMTARVSTPNTRNDIGKVSDMFNHMLDKTESLVIRMKESLDNVAHDLRTPLSHMRLSIEEAVQQKDQDKLREALFDCAEEAEKLERMLKTLMDISEAEAETLNLYPRKINLKELICDSVKQYDFLLEDKHLNLQLDLSEDLHVFADDNRISQVLNNLIDNAIKYTPERGNIMITTRDNHKSVYLKIKDNGIGIAPDDLTRIFERLYRADKSRSTKGLGLGLSLVKAVLHAHGSEIRVQSEPGQGAEFHILFPKNYQKDTTLDWESVLKSTV